MGLPMDGQMQVAMPVPFRIVLDSINMDIISQDEKIVMRFILAHPVFPLVIDVPWDRLTFIKVARTIADHLEWKIVEETSET